VDAIGLFTGDVSQDVLLKEKEIEGTAARFSACPFLRMQRGGKRQCRMSRGQSAGRRSTRS
jgi:hypothetical protein